MQRMIRILLVVGLATAVALPLKGAWRDRAAMPEAPGASFVPPGASWQALFQSGWR